MLSNPTYAALPYAYIGAGALNVVLLESGLRFLPAVLLICAGLLVLLWRFRARVLAKKRPARGRTHTVHHRL